MTPEQLKRLERTYENLVATMDALPLNSERKESNLKEEASISRQVFITMLHKDLLSKHPDSTVTKKEIGYLLNSLTSCLSAVVASNSSVDLGFATIGGSSSLPHPLSGALSGKYLLNNNQTYSDYKTGVPYATFTRKFKQPSSTLSASDYYSQPSLIYTSEAQIFRLRSGVPDPIEFAELTEEQIFRIQSLADTEYLSSFTPKQRARYRDTLRKVTSKPIPILPPPFKDSSNPLSLALAQECTFSNRNFKSLTWDKRTFRIRDHIAHAFRHSSCPILYEHAKFYHDMKDQCEEEFGVVPQPPLISPEEVTFFELLYQWAEDPDNKPDFPIPPKMQRTIELQLKEKELLDFYE